MQFRCANDTNAQSTVDAQRHAWRTSVRDISGRTKHKFWQPILQPPALLSDVAVVLIAPKRPTSVGSVARVLSCFECEDLRIVKPQSMEHHISRSAKNSSKGAQYILWKASIFDSLDDALQDSYASIAFARWSQMTPTVEFSSLPLMYLSQELQHASPTTHGHHMTHMTTHNISESIIHSNDENTTQYTSQHTNAKKKKLVLVFGREVHGLTGDEIACCSAACSIPIGRLQESLSLSHATTLALSSLFTAKQQMLVSQQKEDAHLKDEGSSWSGVVKSREDLAVGISTYDN